MAQVYAIASGKGGVGKSNITLNLGLALAQAGRSVIILDADTNLANINILLDIYPHSTLANILSGEMEIDDVLIKNPQGVHPNLHIVPAASGLIEMVNLCGLKLKRLFNLLKQLEQRYDVILIDAPAGADESLLNLLLKAPSLLLVVTPESTSLTDAFALIKLLQLQGNNSSPHHVPEIHIICNRIEETEMAKRGIKRLRHALISFLGINAPLLGVVREDHLLKQAVSQQRLILDIAPSSSTSHSIRQMAQTLINVKSSGFKLEDLLKKLPTEEPPQLWVTERFKELKQMPAQIAEKVLQQLQIDWQQIANKPSQQTHNTNSLSSSPKIFKGPIEPLNLQQQQLRQQRDREGLQYAFIKARKSRL